MRRLTGLFRILIFSAAVWILWYTHIAIVHAQFGGDSCIKEFDTDGPDGSPCPDCCPNQPIVANIIITPADTSPGYQSPVLQSSDCGSPDCTGIGCGNIQYYVAVQDVSKVILAIKDRVAMVFNVFRITHAAHVFPMTSPVIMTRIAAAGSANPTRTHVVRHVLHSAKNAL